MVYKPNKAIHPGVHVERALESLGMTQRTLSVRTGLSGKHLSQIIGGEASITPETAALFANALGGGVSYWNNLQKNYEETKVRLEKESKAKEEIKYLSDFPYNDLVKINAVEDTFNRTKRVLSLWQFFGVNSLLSIPQTEAVAYRRVYGKGVKKEALAAWLRYGELSATSLQLADFDERELRNLLPSVRKMTRMKDKNFFSKLQGMLEGVGVGLVVAPHLAHTQASGATRWMGGNPLIQVSTYGKDADRMWFTLFHEIGHILLHGKKDTFINFDKNTKSPEEAEADSFAAEILIPEQVYKSFVEKNNFSKNAIMRFASKERISPAIVSGRLKKDGFVSWRQFRDLHEKLVTGLENKEKV